MTISQLEPRCTGDATDLASALRGFVGGDGKGDGAPGWSGKASRIILGSHGT